MTSSIEAVFEAGASLATVHASAGKTALKSLAQLEAKLNEQRPFKVLAVTVLTSWKNVEESSAYKPQTVQETVRGLVNDVTSCGLTGIVCSGHELDMLEEKELFKVVPGIRRTIDASGDQSRIMTPGEALRAGASAIVVGRPIVESSDPRKTAMDFAVGMLGGGF